ncbi:MAG: peptidylprolyl isomerase [Bacteroidetes bacterium]|nr:peptidylprolyl isomerase [Bacteroidota bacterium]HET6245406.1 peptidylprolyl isomerase [Bacteroidia bacterium]
MVVEDKKVVSVSYELSVKEDDAETLIEKTEENNPFVFLFGAGGLLEAFEGNLKGLKPGEKFDFTIAAEHGYGMREKDNVAHIPIEAFLNSEGEMDNEMVRVGNYLPMVDSEGNKLNGMVQDISDKQITMDFNHPLAEKDLRFVGEVLEVRTATEEEITHGHVHGEGGVHHDEE